MVDFHISKTILICLAVFCSNNLLSQNSVGVISYKSNQFLEGYTLLYPLQQANVYLIDKCGGVVHEWVDSSIYQPGISAYLLENGDLLKTKKPSNPISGSFSSGGAGAIVELVSWDNELKWSKEIVNSTFRMHHDVEMLPNGNVLIIVWQRRSRQEFLDAGADTTVLNLPGIWPDVIQEYDPILDSVVWMWDSWDHVVQDHDEDKANFGDVAANPGKINLNYDLGGYGGRPDWIHSNSIDYNEELDQILLSAAHFEEIWIIDHSTTTEEAKGNSGGRFGKGGQLLFRWGNPRTYQKGGLDDKQLFFQHDAHWIDDPWLEDSDYFQQIGLFNNRVEQFVSSINILDPPLSLQSNQYTLESGTYLPTIFEETLLSSEDRPFHSSNMSSMQLLPNGNFFVCAAQKGRVMEVTPGGQVVWDYILPYRNGFRVSQGTQLNIGDNVIFRAKKYDLNYQAFNGKILNPKYYLELEPNTQFCEISLNSKDLSISDFVLFPVPAQDILNINSKDVIIKNVQVFNSIGERMSHFNQVNAFNFTLETSAYYNGFYYIILNNVFMYKVLISN